MRVIKKLTSTKIYNLFDQEFERVRERLPGFSIDLNGR
jgi:hypothetical protein